MNSILLFKIMYGQRLCDDGMARFGDHCSTIGTILLAELTAFDKHFKLIPNFVVLSLNKKKLKACLTLCLQIKQAASLLGISLKKEEATNIAEKSSFYVFYKLTTFYYNLNIVFSALFKKCSFDFILRE